MSLQILHEEILKETKKLLKEKISNNPKTLLKYKSDLKEKYNNYIRFIHTVWNTLDGDSKVTLSDQILGTRNKVRDCYKKLHIPVLHTPYLLDYINYVQSDNPSTELDNLIILDDIQNIFKTATDMDNTTLFKLCSSHINKPYNGDPLGLQSFIDSIELLDTFATTATLSNFLVSFIKTRIEGRARDFIHDTHTTTNQIIVALRANIKHDNSKIIEGKMLSLNAYSATNEEFSKKIEDLSDAFRRSLIVEGITPSKATEMSIDKTIELCRKNTNSTTVKAVLASSKFESPKEVVAKLITETNLAKSEHSIMHFSNMNKSRNSNHKNNFQRKFNNNLHNKNWSNNRSYQNNNPSYRNNNSYNYNSNNYNNRRGKRPFNGNRNRVYNHSNSRNIRFMGAENSSSPQQATLGAENNQNQHEQ